MHRQREHNAEQTSLAELKDACGRQCFRLEPFGRQRRRRRILRRGHGGPTTPAKLDNVRGRANLTVYVNEKLYWDNATIAIRVPPRDDRSAMPDGELILSGAEPDQDTVDAWQRIARTQWHCKLARVPCDRYTWMICNLSSPSG